MAEMVVQVGSPSEMVVAIEGGIDPGDINGVTATGEAVMTAANAAAARTAIGIPDTSLMTSSPGEVPDSEAVDVAGIVADFNELLAELRARNIIT